MTIEYAILGLLSCQPLSGYDIKKMFQGSPAFFWSGNNNQIYTSLVEMHRAGWVERETHEPESGPARKVYTITAAGQEALKKWVYTTPQPPQLRHPFLVQLAWGDLLAPHELQALLDNYASELQHQVDMLEVQRQQAYHTPTGKLRPAYVQPSQARNPREAVLWHMIYQNWIGFYQNELTWVQQLQAQLANTLAT